MKQVDRKTFIFCMVIFMGILFRFWVMTFGSNFDFESYCIVGDLANQHKNIYASTNRYNYGPIFFCIQGGLFWLSKWISNNPIETFRVLIVGILTLSDLGIMLWIANRYSLKKAIIFFLNPISIIITGYHNQFDNIAILLALLSCCFYNEEEKINKKDFVFVLLFSACLMTKHILCFVPFYLLVKKGVSLGKRFLYAFVPPSIFLLSFVPFALDSRDAFNGIKNNVFLYRSYSFSPLFFKIYEILMIPSNLWFVIFVLLMLGLALLIRNQSFEKQILIYLMAMVAFASSVANQYLVIPMVALCILSGGIVRYSYMSMALLYFLLSASEFGLGKEGIVVNFLNSYVFTVEAILLFIVIVKNAVHISKIDSMPRLKKVIDCI